MPETKSDQSMPFEGGLSLSVLSAEWVLFSFLLEFREGLKIFLQFGFVRVKILGNVCLCSIVTYALRLKCMRTAQISTVYLVKLLAYSGTASGCLVL